jgi:hypothetical protein
MTAPGVGTIVVLGYMTGVETPARFSFNICRRLFRDDAEALSIR